MVNDGGYAASPELRFELMVPPQGFEPRTNRL